MANKKKGPGQGKKGARPTPAGSVDASTNAKKEAQSEASQLNTKAQPKDKSSLQPAAKSKQRGAADTTLTKATPPKEPMNKDKEKSKDSEKSGPVDTARNILQFLKEVNVERRKISWPGREQVIRETWSVLVLVAIITGLVLGFDWLLGHLVFGPLEHWARIMGGGVGKG